MIVKSLELRNPKPTKIALWTLQISLLAAALYYAAFADLGDGNMPLFRIVAAWGWFSGLVFVFTDKSLAKKYAIVSVAAAVLAAMCADFGRTGFQPETHARILVVGLPFAAVFWLSKTFLIPFLVIYTIIAAVSVLCIEAALSNWNTTHWAYHLAFAATISLAFVWLIHQEKSFKASIFFLIIMLTNVPFIHQKCIPIAIYAILAMGTIMLLDSSCRIRNKLLRWIIGAVVITAVTLAVTHFICGFFE